MKRYLYITVSSLLSGFFITIGATVYLSCLKAGQGELSAKIWGAVFFGIGLFSIIQWHTWLYTGKVGNTLSKKPSYLIDLLICCLVNILAVIALSALISASTIGQGLKDTALNIVNAKQEAPWYSILITSFGCGIMIYIAVKGHEVCPYPFGKVIICFFAVAVFILCGFDHVIANASYYTYAGYIDWKTILYFIIMAIGNGLGSIFFDGLLKLQNYLRPKENQDLKQEKVEETENKK